jgi:starch phosphorylase
MPRIFFFAEGRTGTGSPSSSSSSSTTSRTRSRDPVVRDRLKVVFLPEYCVSLAERLIPAADISIRSRRPDTKPAAPATWFMMNGALTIGTRDGFVEMAEEAGEDNFFLFGLSAQEVAESAAGHSRSGTTSTSPRPGPRST